MKFHSRSTKENHAKTTELSCKTHGKVVQARAVVELHANKPVQDILAKTVASNTTFEQNQEKYS